MLKDHFEDRFDGRILVARTAGEAFRLLEEHQPDGMLLDVNLGQRLTGFDVLERVRLLSPATKVIMVTAVNDFESVEKAMSLGAVDYVTKPFTVDYLEDTVTAKIATHMMFA